MLQSTSLTKAICSVCFLAHTLAIDVLPEFAPAGGWNRRRATGTLPECHLNYTTDVWTGCTDVLSQFNITFEYFQYSNPGITDHCANFAPGTQYCIFRGKLTAEAFELRPD